MLDMYFKFSIECIADMWWLRDRLDCILYTNRQISNVKLIEASDIGIGLYGINDNKE